MSNKPTPVIDKKRQRDLPQINERIRFPKIRVIDSDGGQLGVITPQEAIRIAEERENRLVLGRHGIVFTHQASIEF